MRVPIVRNGLTQIQLDMLQLVRRHQRKRGLTPSQKEIAGLMKTSEQTIGYQVRALEKKRAITRPTVSGGGSTVRKSPCAITVLIPDDVLFHGEVA